MRNEDVIEGEIMEAATETQVAKYQPASVVAIKSYADVPAMSVNQAVERYGMVKDFISKILVKNRDFGVIPGTGTKPVLLKPGAEKFVTFFGLRPRFIQTRAVRDYKAGLIEFDYRCELLKGDQVIGDGEGSCNSYEKKYRYRKAERVCPACGKPAVIKGKSDYGGGWLCWKKKDGCGATYQDGDPAIESQQSGQVENPDPAENTNTIMKMAQKRALIAAVLVTINASDYFTQDIEDAHELEGADDAPQTPVTPPQRRSAGQTTANAPASQPAAPQTPPAAKRGGWRTVGLADLTSTKSKNGSIRTAVKIIGAPDKDATGHDIPWPATFDSKIGDMLAETRASGKSINLYIEPKGGFYNITEAKWPAPEDDPANYPPRDAGEPSADEAAQPNQIRIHCSTIPPKKWMEDMTAAGFMGNANDPDWLAPVTLETEALAREIEAEPWCESVTHE